MRGDISPTRRLAGHVFSLNEVVDVVWTPGKGVGDDFILTTILPLYTKLVLSIVHLNNRDRLKPVM